MKSLISFLMIVSMALGAPLSIDARTVQSTVKVGRKTVHFSEVLASNGRPLQRVMTDGFNTEILLDYNADGVVDDWEVTRGDVTVRGRYPYRGQFMTLLMQRREKKGIRHLAFDLTKDRKQYQLVHHSFEPHRIHYKYKKHTYQRVTISRTLEDAACELSPDPTQAVSDQWDEIMRKFLSHGEQVDRMEMMGAIGSNLNPLIDQSCREGKFKDSINHLVAGVADVVMSSNPVEGGRRDFLSCMDDLGLLHHSGKMRAMLANINAKGEEKPLIRCEAHSNQSVHGTWDGERQIVRIARPVEDLESKAGIKAEAEYGKTFFHEMLHAAGMTDEGMVHSIEQCCSGDNPGNNASCVAAKRLVSTELYAIAYDGVFQQYSDHYLTLRSNVFADLGPSLGSVFISSYMEGLQDKQMLTKEWDEKNCQGVTKLECTKRFIWAMNDNNDRFFREKCNPIFQAGSSRTENRCEMYYEMTKSILDHGMDKIKSCEQSAGARDAHRENQSFKNAIAELGLVPRAHAVETVAEVMGRGVDCSDAYVYYQKLGTEFQTNYIPLVRPASANTPGVTRNAVGGAQTSLTNNGDLPRIPNEGARASSYQEQANRASSDGSGNYVVGNPVSMIPVDTQNPESVKEYLAAGRPTSSFVDPAARAFASASKMVPQASAESRPNGRRGPDTLGPNALPLKANTPKTRATTSATESSPSRLRVLGSRRRDVQNYRFTNPVPSMDRSEKLDGPLKGPSMGNTGSAAGRDISSIAKVNVPSEPVATMTTRSNKSEPSASARTSQLQAGASSGGNQGTLSSPRSGSGSGGSGGFLPSSGSARAASARDRKGRGSEAALPELRTYSELRNFLLGDYRNFERHQADSRLLQYLEQHKIRVIPKQGRPLIPPKYERTYKYKPAAGRLVED